MEMQLYRIRNIERTENKHIIHSYCLTTIDKFLYRDYSISILIKPGKYIFYLCIEILLSKLKGIAIILLSCAEFHLAILLTTDHFWAYFFKCIYTCGLPWIPISSWTARTTLVTSCLVMKPSLFKSYKVNVHRSFSYVVPRKSVDNETNISCDSEGISREIKILLLKVWKLLWNNKYA